MSERVLPFVARTQAFVFELPSGEKRLVATASFDDHAVWRIKRDFDGREEVDFRVPTIAGPWQPIAAMYRGTAAQYDLHTIAVNLGAAPIDLAALLRYGIAASAVVRGPWRGAELLHFQPYAQNTPVHDVGRVDEHGIKWISGVTARRIHRYDDRATPVGNGDTVSFRASEFGIPGNLRFELDVFAPEHTPIFGASPDQKRRAIDTMRLRVESDFFPPGERSRPLRYIHNVGPNGNNFRVGFELADPSIFNPPGGAWNPPTGRYPVRIMKGNDVVSTFTLDWHAA